MSFNRARVLCFESRREKEIGELVRINGGEPFVAPALVEIPIEDNEEAFSFARRLYNREFEMVIFLTGVGARYLQRVLVTREPEGKLQTALRELAVVVRGPKPLAVMREWNVPVAAQAPEPNTYRELLGAVSDRAEKSVALQEYGRPNRALIEGLTAQGRDVTTVSVYQWAIPSDTQPLTHAVEGLLAGQYDVSVFTTGVQIEHLLEFADQHGHREAVRHALKKTFIASIGPTCSESLRENGLVPNLEPSHPKMGILVRECALEYAKRLAQN